MRRRLPVDVLPPAFDQPGGYAEGWGARQLPRADQLVARAAARMTRVTVPGWEISDRCEAFTSVMWAPAR